MKKLVRTIVFGVISLISFNGFCASGEPRDPDAGKNVGSFICTDCEMTLGPVGPDTTIWIETVVNTFVDSWITSSGDPKHFFNCTISTCTRVDYVKSGTWVVTAVFPNYGNETYKAIGSAEGGANPAPSGASSGGGGGGGIGGSGDYWIGYSYNYCYEYFSNGHSEGTFCYATP